MPLLNKCPVYLMMKPEEQYDNVLISVIDIMIKNLRIRNACNEKRSYNLQQAFKYLHRAEQTFVGALPDELTNKAEKFNKMINADLKGLLQYVK